MTAISEELSDERLEYQIDELRLKAFRTNDPSDRKVYFDAASKWFQGRHFRRMDEARSVRDAAWEECAVVADVTAKTLLSIYEGDGAAGARDVAAAIRKLVAERNTP